MCPILAHEGRLLETILKAERGVAFRGLRLVTASLGRLGTPPARHYDLAARSSLHGSGGNAGDGSAGPGLKPPRWSAERRASLRIRGTRAPRWVPGPLRYCGPTGTAAPVRLSALRPPLVGVETLQTPGANAPRERIGLFEIVRRVSVGWGEFLRSPTITSPTPKRGVSQALDPTYGLRFAFWP